MTCFFFFKSVAKRLLGRFASSHERAFQRLQQLKGDSLLDLYLLRPLIASVDGSTGLMLHLLYPFNTNTTHKGNGLGDDEEEEKEEAIERNATLVGLKSLFGQTYSLRWFLGRNSIKDVDQLVESIFK